MAKLNLLLNGEMLINGNSIEFNDMNVEFTDVTAISDLVAEFIGEECDCELCSCVDECDNNEEEMSEATEDFLNVVQSLYDKLKETKTEQKEIEVEVDVEDLNKKIDEEINKSIFETLEEESKTKQPKFDVVEIDLEVLKNLFSEKTKEDRNTVYKKPRTSLFTDILPDLFL